MNLDIDGWNWLAMYIESNAPEAVPIRCIPSSRTYEQEGRGGEGYNGIEGDCERGNAVIEDIFGTGDGWNFSRWISGTLISEMRGLIQELGWLQSVSKITSL